MKLKLISICLLFFSFRLYAVAGAQNARISINAKNTKLEDVFSEIQEKTGYNFMFNHEDIEEFKVNGNFPDTPVNKILDQVLEDLPLSYKFEDNVILISKKDKIPQQQEDKKIITGKVVTNKGEPLPGTAVVVQGTNKGTTTDKHGKYKITVSEGDALTFMFIGMKSSVILVENKEVIDMVLYPLEENIEEVSVVAFGEQKKESVVSAITSVKAEDLMTSNSDLTSALAGKISGLIGWQTGGIPGALTEDEVNTSFYVRGITSYQTKANIDPLILLDGIEVSKLDLSRINPEDIESFNVMKDASATAMYGARGANGVIYVKTKKGKAGDVYTTFRYEKIMSMPTREIDVVGPKEYMELYNEAIVARHPGSAPKYTRERIDNTLNPNYPSYVYPGNDWYDKLFKDFSLNDHLSLNVRGGSEKIQYYASFTHNSDQGMIKTDPLNQFDCNIKNRQTTFRTNLNIDLNKNSKLIMNSFSTYDNYHGPNQDMKTAYFMAFQANPVDFAPTYPKDTYYTWPHIRFGGSESSENPYAAIQSGYKDRIRYSTINNFEFQRNLTDLVKGLEFRGSIGYTKTGYFTNAYRYTPAFYQLKEYDFATGQHYLVALNEREADQMLKKDLYGSAGENLSQTVMDYQAKFIHAAAWDDHQTGFTAVFTARQMDNSLPETLQKSLPQRNIGFAFRATYGYKDRYFFEGNCGINGSERFAKHNRIGVFPAFGAAWVASHEDFLRSAQNWLNFLKFRISYGQTGNDGVIKDPRFVYLQQIENSDAFEVGYPQAPTIGYNIKNYENLETKWEVAEMANFGAELKLFKGLADLNIDVYQEIRHNIYDYRRTLPVSMGLYQPPLDNVGKVRSRGVDFSGKIQHAFSSDLWFILNTTFTYNRATYLEIEEPTNKPDWQKKVGHDISQQYCYIAEGIFQDQEEIDNSPVQSGDVQPGDIRYKDIDGNGRIDVNDAVMVGYPETPRIIYGFSGFVHYKLFELNMSFQGAGNRSFFINPEQISPFYQNRAVLRAIADDHWSPDNQKDDPFWPKLSDANIIEHNPQENYYQPENAEVRKSTFFIQNGRFLRCKQIELAAYLKKEWLKKYKIQNFKIFCRTENPFIISKFKLWDVELGENGFNYPIQKTYSLGMSLSF